MSFQWPLSYTKEVNQRFVKLPLKTNGRLGNHWLTSLVKEATGNKVQSCMLDYFKSTSQNEIFIYTFHWAIHTQSFESVYSIIQQTNFFLP